MIAPLRQTEREPPSGSLQQARRALAAMLFEPETEPPAEPPLWTAPKSWLFVTWILIVLSAYAGFMLGLFAH